MNRRSLLSAVVGAASAIVFSASGWLMGTRTLTMPPPDVTPPPNCPNFCSYFGFCRSSGTCPGPDYCDRIIQYNFALDCASGPFCGVERIQCYCCCGGSLCTF
jgi:hypothetical protein